MKTADRAKTKFILALGALIISCVFLLAEAFAWFVLGGQAGVDGLDMGVIDIVSDSDELIVGIGGGSGKSASLLPGAYLSAKVTLHNGGENAKEYALYLQNAVVDFPFVKEGYRYGDKYIDLDSYYKGDTLYDYTADAEYTADKQKFFKNFVSPVSDALLFKTSVVRQTAFGGAFAPDGYMTDAGPVGDVTDTVTYPLDTALSISDIGLEGGAGNDSEGNYVVIKDGKITVAAGSDAVVYILIYFDPAKYAVSEGGLELKNSNAYMNQNLWVSIGSR